MLSVDLSLRCWMKVFCVMQTVIYYRANDYKFDINAAAPETVNPSLWRQSQIQRHFRPVQSHR